MTRHGNPDDSRSERVRIPADVDREDRLLGNLTARQLAILTAAAAGLWVLWAATRRLLPLPVFAGLAAPLAGAAVLLAVGRWHGLPADRLLAAMLRQHLSPRRLVPAPDGIPENPRQHRENQPQLGPLELPVVGIAQDGTLDLGAHGTAVLARAAAVSFALRTQAEREALAAGFGRYLNSLAAPVQLLLGAEPVDLTPVVAELSNAAPGLPHPLLEAVCRDHADYLQTFAAGRPLLRREVLLVLRAPKPATPAPSERRRAKSDSPVTARESPDESQPALVSAETGDLARVAVDAAAALAGAGVTLTVLDGPAAAARLRRALNPHDPRPVDGAALPDAVITRSRP